MHRPSSITSTRFPGAPPAHRGFTLIGVLIALAVIAITLLTLLSVAARSTHVATALQQRNFANWIAQNQIARLRLAPEWPDLGRSTGFVHFANQQWQYEVEVAKTSDAALRRITVSVALSSQPDKPVTSLIGFIGKHTAGVVPLPEPGKGKAPDDERGNP